MESSVLQNQTSSVGAITTSVMYSSSPPLSSLQTSTPEIFSTPGILSTLKIVSSPDILPSSLATVDDTSASQLVSSRLSLLQGPSSTLPNDSQTSTLTTTHLPVVTLTSSLSELSASASSQPPVSTPALEASSSVDVAGKSEGPSSIAAKLSASSTSDLSYQVSSTPQTSTTIKYSELSDFVSSDTFPISDNPLLVTSSTEISSFESGTPILSSLSKIQPTPDVTLSSPITQTSSTFYSSSPSLMASSTQLSTLNPLVSSTSLQSQSSTQNMSTDPISIQPTSSMKTFTPSGVFPVLPTTVTPAVTPTTGKTNDTISSTPSPLLGTGLELIIALSIIGAGLLIFFIITVCVCVRRKKPRKQEKYDPSAATEDLWVSRTEIPLNHIDPLPQIKTTSEDNGSTNKFGNGIGITHFNTATVKRSYSPAFRHSVRFLDEVEEKYITKFDFEGKDEGYLSLLEGDIVVVVHKDNNGWWTGSLNGKTGLFPGNYVKEIPPEVDFEKNNRLSNGSQPFEISLDVDNSAPRPVSSFMSPEPGFTKKASTLQRESNITSSLTRHVLGKKVEIPHIPDEVEDDSEQEDKASKRRSTISPVKEDLNIDGVQFKVLCSYTANFKEEISLQEGEIVTGIKKDRNGWMYGRKNRTNEIGHFPAVHVEKATSEDIEAASYSQFGYPDKATVYKQLQANKTSHHDEDLIGIEHRALHYYAAEDEQDLSFDKGDIILVYEVNENGWWRGKHGEEVGWFPGSYVELVDEDPSELKYKGPDELSVPTDQRVRSSSFLSVGSAANISKTSDEETASICSTGTTDSRRRPARKAPPPPPPMSARSPKTPTSKQLPRPSNVPWASQAESTPIDKSGNQSRDFSLNGSTKSFNDSDSVDGGPNRSVKPEVPKRFIKPKLVKISKKKINLKSTSSSMRATKSPPPPRPEYPKHIPKSPLNRSKDDSNQYSKLNGTHNSIPESLESRSNNQNHSNTMESDISGVEPLQQSGSEKDQSLLQNESEIGNSRNSLSKNSKPGGIGEQTENSSTLPSLINKPTELSPNEARHSTPKYHDTPKFSDPPIFNGRKLNGSVEGDSTVPESETSITEVSGLDETDGDMKSLKVPPSPKRSRLPTLSGETGANAHRARSKERPPPVAPKPLHRPSQIQRLRSIERNQSEVDNSSHDQSSLHDDSSSILIHDGLDSSNSNSAYLSDSHNQSASAQIKRPNVSISQKSPQKQTTNNTRIPKTSSGATKRPSSVMTGKQSENLSKDYNRQTSTTSQNSGGFPETLSPGKPPTPKPKRPDNPPMKSDTPTRRKTSASPSRIPLGKSPTRKSSDSGAKSKLPQTNSPDHSKSSMLSKIPTVPTTDGQKGGLTKSSSTENPKSLSKIPSTEKSSPSKRGRSAIPKIPRPSRPFVPVEQVGAGGDNTSVMPHRLVVKKAVSGYEALNEGELSFDEGSLITELSKDAGNPGWCVGRLPDGTTGRFHASFVEDVPAEDLVAV